MRKVLLSLSAAALVVGACSSSSLPGPSNGYAAPRPPPDNHRATPAPTTNGTPNSGGPYGGVTYQDPGTNPWVDPTHDDQSTFGLDVDTASWGIAQRYVDDGNLPDPASVRLEEWVNAFPQDYPTPRDGTFSIVADGGPTPFLERDEQLLRIGLQAKTVFDLKRQPAALTLVIDTSGSMGIQDRLETVKGALRILVRHLSGDDRVAIVSFGSDARVVLPPTSAEGASTILAAIEELQPGGSTNLEAGLRMGYDLARRTMTEAGIDRIVLASDGVANVGLTDAEEILGQIREDAANGIELVSVGVGMGNYNDVLLEQLADHGDGFYAYVNTRDEAEALFRDRLTQTLQSVALDAKAQVTFDRETVEQYRLLGYENRAIADRDFTDPGVDAGAIGSGHSVTALCALRLTPGAGPQAHIGTVELRWTDPDSGRTQSAERDVRTSAFASSFRGADPHFRFDAIVAATAQALHGDSIGDLSLRDVADVAQDEHELLPATPEVQSFLDFLDRVARR